MKETRSLFIKAIQKFLLKWDEKEKSAYSPALFLSVLNVDKETLKREKNEAKKSVMSARIHKQTL